MPGFVNVPVPLDRVQEVYALLARQPAKRLSGDWAADGGTESWGPVLLERMFLESSSAMRRILLSIAHASPRWVTTGEIAGATGLTARQVVASLGPFGKRVRGRYGMNRWPFEAREFVDAGAFKYSMPSETAGMISTLAAHAEQLG
ncbi:MAG: hypothetical protein ACYC77_04305 [Coriobacteriia bacterium]